jgi:glucose dehydrogenase
MKPEPPGSSLRYRLSGEWARFWDQNHYPCTQPPWGTLTAIDLNTGDNVWKVPLGVFDELVANGIPPTGTPNLGGSIVTAGGLVFIGGSADRRFRAFDAATGKVLWETLLEASGHATPMTYLGKNTGKQYVVIAASGGYDFPAGTGRGPSEKISDTVDAFTLP